MESHAKWAEKLCLPYTILADPTGNTARAYGVRKGIGPLQVASRVTFIIDREGKIARVFDSVSPRGHAEEVLGAAKSLRLTG